MELAEYWAEFHAAVETRSVDTFKYHVRGASPMSPDEGLDVVVYATDSLSKACGYAKLHGLAKCVIWQRIEVGSFEVSKPAEATKEGGELFDE